MLFSRPRPPAGIVARIPCILVRHAVDLAGNDTMSVLPSLESGCAPRSGQAPSLRVVASPQEKRM
jgi:hypothetical protein